MALTYKIQFNADTKSLQSQLAAIQKEVEQVSKINLFTGAATDITEGISAAKTLEAALKKATTINGVGFNAMNIELRKAGVSVSDMVTRLSSSGLQSSLSTFVNSFTFANRNAVVLSDKIAEMGRVLTQSFKFSTAQSFIQFMQSSLNDGIRWSEDMNKALTDISIVTGAMGEDLSNIFDSILGKSKELGVAAKEYAEAALIFYQQGLGADEVERRSEVTVKAARAAGESTKEMSEQLTAVWNTYQMQGERLENAASIGARLGAETAVDFKYIAEAMQVAATAASQLGVSYESLGSIIATVGETTLQSASTVGNAFKTIFSRFANLKTTGEDEGVTLGRITEQFKDMGVNVLDAAGELRELDDVIMELGLKWDKYSVKQQQAIAQIAGGTRQFGQFLALMQNFDKYQNNLQSALSEVGSSTLEAQFETWSNSIDAVSRRMKESWASAFAEIFDQDSIKSFYSAVEGLGNIFHGLVSELKGIEGIAITLGVIFAKQIGGGLTSAVITAHQYLTTLTLTGKIEAGRVGLAKQRAVIEAQLGNIQSGVIKGNRLDYELALSKIKSSEQLNESVVRLQNLRDKGNTQQAAYATTELQILETTQQQYFTSLDKSVELQRQLLIQERTAAVITGAQTAGIRELEALWDKESVTGSLSDKEKARVATLEKELLLYDAQLTKIEEQNIALKLQQNIADSAADLAADDLKARTDAINDIDLEPPRGMKGLAESFTGLAMGAMSTVMALEQLHAVMTGEQEANLGTWIGILMQGFLGISSIIKNLVPAAQALWATIQAGATATGIALGPFIAIIVAIGVAIAAVVLIAKTLYDATPGAKLKVAKQAAADLKEELNKATEAADNLRSAFDAYDAAVEKLKSCVKGTTEWRDALREVNEEAINVLLNNPQLAQQADLFKQNADGILEVNKELVATLQAEADAKVQSSKFASLVGAAQVQRAEVAVQGGKTSDKLYEATANGMFFGMEPVIEKIKLDAETLSKMNNQELHNAIKQMADGLSEASYNWDSYTKEEQDHLREINSNFADTIVQNRDTLTDLSAASMKAENAFANISKAMTAEAFTGESDAVKKIMEDTNTEVLDKLYNDFVKMGTDGISQFTSVNDKAQAAFDRYAEAAGLINQKLVDTTGNDNNRKFVFRDKITGEEQTKTLEEMAATVAAAEALKEMGATAVEVRHRLENLDKTIGIVNKTAASDAPGTTSEKNSAMSKAMTSVIAGGDFTQLTGKEYNIVAEVLGPQGQNVDIYLEELAKTTGLYTDEWGQMANGLGQLIDESGNVIKNTEGDILQATGELTVDVEHQARLLGATSALALSTSFKGNLKLDNVVKQLADAGFGKIGKQIGETLANETGSKVIALHKQITETMGDGKEAGERFIKSFEEVLQDVNPEDLGSAVNSLIDGLDFGSINDKFEGLMNSFDSKMSVSEQFSWLGNANKEIANMNRQIQVLNSVNGTAVAGIEKLSVASLQQDEHLRVQTALQTQLQIANGQLAVAQAAVNDTTKESNTLMTKYKEIFGENAQFGQTYIDGMLKAYGEGGDEGLKKVDEFIQHHKDLIAEGKDTSGAWAAMVPVMQDFRNELENDSLEVQKAEFNIKALQRSIFESEAKVKASQLGLEDMADITDALAKGFLTFDEAAFLTLELCNSIEDLDQAMKLGLISADAYSNKFIALVDDLGDLEAAFNDGRVSLEQYGRARERLNKQSMLAGFDKKEVDDYAKHLQKVADASDRLSSSLKKDADAAEKVAASILRQNRAIETVTKSIDTWRKNLKEAGVEDTDFAQTITEITNAMEDMLGFSGNVLSFDFVSSVENLKLLEEAAKGSEEALDRLAQLAAEDIAVQAKMEMGIDIEQAKIDAHSEIQNLLDMLDQAYPNGIELGATIDDTDFIKAANQLIASGKYTEESLNALFSSIGLHPNVKLVDQEVETSNPIIETRTSMRADGTMSIPHATPDGKIEYTEVPAMVLTQSSNTIGYTHEKGIVQVPAMTTDGSDPDVVTSFVATGGGNKSTKAVNNATTGGASNPKVKDTKGGGGSKDKKPTEITPTDLKLKAAPKDDKVSEPKEIYQRYEDINAALREQENHLNKIDVASSHAYGAAKQALLSANIKSLQKEISLQQKLIDEAEAYLVIDQKAADQKAREVTGIGIQVNSEGAITNLEEIKKAADAYTAGVNTSVKEVIETARQEYNFTVQELNKGSQEVVNEAVKTGEVVVKSGKEAETASAKSLANTEKAAKVIADAQADMNKGAQGIADTAVKAAGEIADSSAKQVKAVEKGAKDAAKAADTAGKNSGKQAQENAKVIVNANKEVTKSANERDKAMDKVSAKTKEEAEAMKKSITEAYTAAIAEGADIKEATKVAEEAAKAAGADAEEIFKAIEEAANAWLTETIKKAEELDKYLKKSDETAAKVVQETAKAVEMVYKWLNLKIEEATYMHDLRISISKVDMQIMDLFMRRYAKSAENVLHRVEQIKDNWHNIALQSNEALTAVDKLMNIKDSLNNPQDAAAFKKEYGISDEVWDEFRRSGEIPKEVIDALDKKQQELIGFVNQLYDEYAKFWEEYINVLNEFASRFDEITSHLDGNLQILSALTNIWEKSGKQYQDSATSLKILGTQADTAGKKVDSLKAKWDVYREAADRAKADYQWAQGQGFDDITMDGFKRAMDTATKIADEAHVAFVQGVSDYLDLIAELEQKNAEIIYRTWAASLKGLFADIDSAMAMYNQKKAIDEYFLTDVNKEYRLGSLVDQIVQDLAELTDPAALNAFNAFMEKLNKRRADGVKMTEVQAQIAEKEYELLKAQYALKEAQQHKEDAANSMRLARDSSGNWNYIYNEDITSKDNDVNNLNKKIKDLENDIYNLHRNAADAASEAWLQNRVAYSEYLMEIDWTRYNHDLAYKQEVDQTIKWYEEQSRLFAATVTEHNAAINRSFDETTLGVIVDLNSMAEAEDWYQQHHTDLKDQLMRNHDEWQAKARETQERVGFSYDYLSQIVDRATHDIMDDNNETMRNLEELRRVAEQVLRDMSAEARNMASEWNSAMQEVINACMAAIAAIQQLKSEQASAAAEAAAQAKDGSSKNVLNYNADTLDYLRGLDPDKMSARDKKMLNDLEAANTAKLKGGDMTYYNSKEWLDYTNKYHNDMKDVYDETNVTWHVTRDLTSDWNRSLQDLTNATQSTINKLNTLKSLNDPGIRYTDTGTPYRTDMTLQPVTPYNPYGKAGGGYVRLPEITPIAEAGPELVLNPEDTKNILNAVAMTRRNTEGDIQAAVISAIRDLPELIMARINMNNAALANEANPSASRFPGSTTTTAPAGPGNLTINADFPNASSRDEIQAAFCDMLNRAAQYKIPERAS